MAKITIEIDTNNAAFEDRPGELRRMCDQARDIALTFNRRKPPHLDSEAKLLDTNGNTCGVVRVTHN